MKLFIADDTCSRAIQLVANELELDPEIVHYDVFGKSTSTGESFADINPLGYVPALQLDTPSRDILTETAIIASYLADQHPESGLAPRHGTLERVKLDVLLNFVGTEIAQKHIPLMRKLLTEDGAAWTRNKLVMAYARLDGMLADGRTWLTGEQFTVLDAYVWATLWHQRSGARIEHLARLFAWKERLESRPSAKKTLQDEAEIVAGHKQRIAETAAA